MRYFPVFMDLENQPVLLVGGGEVAARKARLLLQAGASVDVVAEHLGDDLSRWARERRIRRLDGPYSPDLLTGKRLVFAATDDTSLNQAVFQDAEAAGVPVNVVDDPSRCRFISPAIVDRSPVQIAVTSGGGSPVLARRIRALIEALLPQGIGKVALGAAAIRSNVKSSLPLAARRRYWESILTPSNMMRWSGWPVGRIAEAMGGAMGGAIAGPGKRPDGMVYVVGAGPGNADLLTLRAAAVLGQADVVLHDALVSNEILGRARRDARLVDVGKRAGATRLAQEDIQRLMVKYARQGRTVIRLKGGDPFVFGRGGEEIEYLRRHGVAYEVVPGITAAMGCAAHAGIPLTHRDHAQALTLVTGHSCAGPDGQGVASITDWSAIAGPGRTVAVYMGVRQAAGIREQLLDAGIEPSLPAALISAGTRSDQAVRLGSVDTLAAMAASADTGSPGLFIIGDVAGLGARLGWFEEPHCEVNGELQSGAAALRPAA